MRRTKLSVIQTALSWRFFVWISLVIIHLGSSTSALAGQERIEQRITLSAEHNDSGWIGRDIQYYEDINRTLKLEDIMAVNDWERPSSSLVTLGFSDSAYWFRLGIDCRTDQIKPLYLELDYGFLDEVDFFVVRENSPVKEQSFGDRLPFDKRIIKTRGFVLPFNCAPDEQIDVYARTKATESIILPVRIWSPTAHSDKERGEEFVYGLVFGMLAFIVFFYFMLFLATRDKDFGYYCLYLALHSAFQLSFCGIGFQYLWPNEVDWQNRSIATLSGLTLGAGLLFIAHFIRLQDHSPFLTKLYAFLGMGSLVTSLIIAPVFGIQTGLTLISVFAAASGAAVVTGCFISARRGFTLAYLAMAAFGVIASVIVLNGLLALSWIEGSYFIIRLPQAALGLEGTVLAMGVILKFRVVQAEREQARTQAILLKREAHENQERLTNELLRAKSLVLGRQMSPHYLSNQLNNLTYLVTDQPEQAVESLEVLATFYRTLMQYVELAHISANDEKAFLQQYIQTSLGDSHRFDIDLHFEVANETELPTMILQPLIENSVEHGMATVREDGLILVNVNSAGDNIILSVEDNGQGLATTNPDVIFQPGHALFCIRERVSLLYGDAGSMTVESGAAGGAIVSVSIPNRIMAEAK